MKGTFMLKNKTLTGYLFVILSAVIFGFMPLMAKFIYNDGVNSITLVLLRNALSVPILALIVICSGKSLKITKNAIPSISVIAIFGCCITPLLLFTSYNYISSGTATVFHFIYPAFVVLVEILLRRTKVCISNISSLILCAAGIFLFYTPGQHLHPTGSLIALLSGVTYAVYILLLSGFRYKEISGFRFSFYVALICSVVLLAVCISTGQLHLPKSFFGWGMSLFFAAVLNVGAVVLFQAGTFIIGGGKASVLSTFEPVTGILAGTLILGEPFGFRTAIGAVLVILASVIIASRDICKKKKDTDCTG